MKNTMSSILALTVLLSVSLSCTFLKDKIASGEKPADEFRKIAKLQLPHLKEPSISPGMVAIRELAKVDPGVATFAASIESNERSAMKKVVAANSHQQETNAKRDKAANTVLAAPGRGTMAFAGPGALPALFMFQAGDVPLPGITDGVMIGMLAGTFKEMLADVDAGSYSKKDSKTETTDGVSTTMDYEFGATSDGSTSFGFGLKTEAVKNGVKVNTEAFGKIEGNDCPNAEGQVQITAKLRLTARSAGAGYTQELTAFIRIQVDDNANNAATTIDINQATSRGKAGQEVYVESGQTIKVTGGDYGNATQSNAHIIQKTDNATQSDVNDLAASGITAAYGAAIAAIHTAENIWKGGKCIKIEARAPGTVEPASGTEIPVKVRHRKDGSELATKLEVTLVGENSIDPTLIPQTPGTLMYVAPGETGKSATIKLKATSRRGMATLDLPANTGTNAYKIAGGLDDWYTNTIVCDITKPFTLTGGGFTMKLSGGLSGTYEYSGPFGAMGTGTYEITFPYGAGKAGEMIGRGDGSVDGDGTRFHGYGEERYSLMTVDGPCEDGPVKE